MSFTFGRGLINSEKVWDCYMHVNNFGFHDKIRVSRPKGRTDYQIIFIVDGGAYFTIDNKEILLTKNTGVLFCPGEPQIYHEAEGCLCYWIHFSGYEIPALLERMGITKPVFKINDTDGIRVLFGKMFDATAIENPSCEDVLNSIFIRILSKINDENNISDKNILKVISYMKSEDFAGLSSSEYAEMAGLSEYHFIRKFKKMTGMSPTKYKSKLLAEKAGELLRSTDMNITEIAYSLGFDDSLYFSRFFKKNTGVSPKKYRGNVDF